jgi:hypothetical protein
MIWWVTAHILWAFPTQGKMKLLFLCPLPLLPFSDFLNEQPAMEYMTVIPFHEEAS